MLGLIGIGSTADVDATTPEPRPAAAAVSDSPNQEEVAIAWRDTLPLGTDVIATTAVGDLCRFDDLPGNEGRPRGLNVDEGYAVLLPEGASISSMKAFGLQPFTSQQREDAGCPVTVPDATPSPTPDAVAPTEADPTENTAPAPAPSTSSAPERTPVSTEAPEPKPAPTAEPTPAPTKTAEPEPKPTQTSEPAPKPAEPKPEPSSPPPSGGDHPTCAEHKKRGEGPFHEGSDEYERHQDRDGDGVVCE